MIIAVDFDAVIADGSMQPIEGALVSIKRLIELGHEPYIMTARVKSDHKNVKYWLETHDFPELEVTNIKKNHVRVIIDDRAIRFEDNWKSIIKLFG